MPTPFRPLSPPAAAAGLLLFLLLQSAAPFARAYSLGYDTCDREFAGHGVNNPGAAGGFQLVLKDAASGAAATSWTAGHTYSVTLQAPAGATFRGAVVAPFQGSAATVADWTGPLHGALAAAGSGSGLRAMLYCPGGVTPSSRPSRARPRRSRTGPAQCTARSRRVAACAPCSSARAA